MRRTSRRGDDLSPHGALPLLDQACASKRVMQPELFVEMAEQLAQEKSIQNGGMGEGVSSTAVTSRQGACHQALRPLKIDGRTVHTSASRSTGDSPARRKRVLREHAEACRRRRQLGDAGVQGVSWSMSKIRAPPNETPVAAGPASKQKAEEVRTWHVNRLTSSAAPPPRSRRQRRAQTAVEVAKLIDTTKCIGCKACQVACLEWNDLRDDVGTTSAPTTTLRISPTTPGR